MPVPQASSLRRVSSWPFLTSRPNCSPKPSTSSSGASSRLSVVVSSSTTTDGAVSRPATWRSRSAVRSRVAPLLRSTRRRVNGARPTSRRSDPVLTATWLSVCSTVSDWGAGDGSTTMPSPVPSSPSTAAPAGARVSLRQSGCGALMRSSKAVTSVGGSSRSGRLGICVSTPWASRGSPVSQPGMTPSCTPGSASTERVTVSCVPCWTCWTRRSRRVWGGVDEDWCMVTPSPRRR